MSAIQLYELCWYVAISCSLLKCYSNLLVYVTMRVNVAVASKLPFDFIRKPVEILSYSNFN